jgi:secondary thiamine-phosphate synthase enzyme
MTRFIIKTKKKKEVVDVTNMIAEKIPDDFSGVCNLFLTHTTAALTTADLDPGTDLDMLDAFAAIVPKLNYRHPHDPAHTPDHIMSSLIGTSLTVPVEKGQLILGAWQRVVLIELDGPRERNIVILCYKA